MSEVGFSIHWTAAQGNVLALILGMILVPLLAWWWLDRETWDGGEPGLLLFALMVLAFLALIVLPLSFLWDAKL